MKELDGKKKDQVEIHAQKQIEKHEEYMGSMKMRPGMKIFEFDLSKRQPRPVDVTPVKKQVEFAAAKGKFSMYDIKKDDFGTRYQMSFENPVNVQKFQGKLNHFYCLAINEKNAVKKYTKYRLQTLINQMKKKQNEAQSQSSQGE